MFTILLHSSKTMRTPDGTKEVEATTPLLLQKARKLGAHIQLLSVEQLMDVMKISRPLAEKTHNTLQAWRADASGTPAIDSFLGDIYSGLQASSLTSEDRAYAQDRLFILSGLYGALRPLDAVRPYRLEMGYKVPGLGGDTPEEAVKHLYEYWGDAIARVLPGSAFIINLSAVEYTKAVLPYCKNTPIITPKFLTRSSKTGEPTFVTVHTKIARGAFAHWLITQRIEDVVALKEFAELGYKYNTQLSTELEPVFVADTFKGIGLSVRLR